MTPPFDGVFLGGWSLAETPVHVVLSDLDLRMQQGDGRELRVWSLVGLHVDAMQEGHAYHVTHASAPGEQLVLHQPELAARLLQSASQVSVLPGGRHKVAYGLAGLAALALVLGLLYWSAPRLAVSVARRIPLEQERALGGRLEFFLQFDHCESVEAQRVLRDMLTELGERSDVEYDVRIIHSDAPNAFALPGGVILVTSAFLREAESGDEIVGVLAHEVEHIAQRHVLAGALRGALLTALWSLTLGDYSGLMVVDPSTAYRIANLEFSREDEQSADDGAVRRLHRAGLSHHGLIDFFERVTHDHEDESDGLAWLSTHPSSATRTRALKDTADIPHARAPFDQTQMKTLRSACP